jgi:hypothetical protein
MGSPDRNYGIVRWNGGGYQIVGKLSLEVFKANPEGFFCTLVADNLTQEEADALFKLLPQDE